MYGPFRKACRVVHVCQNRRRKRRGASDVPYESSKELVFEKKAFCPNEPPEFSIFLVSRWIGFGIFEVVHSRSWLQGAVSSEKSLDKVSSIFSARIWSGSLPRQSWVIYITGTTWCKDSGLTSAWCRHSSWCMDRNMIDCATRIRGHLGHHFLTVQPGFRKKALCLDTDAAEACPSPAKARSRSVFSKLKCPWSEPEFGNLVHHSQAQAGRRALTSINLYWHLGKRASGETILLQEFLNCKTKPGSPLVVLKNTFFEMAMVNNAHVRGTSTGWRCVWTISISLSTSCLELVSREQHHCFRVIQELPISWIQHPALESRLHTMDRKEDSGEDKGAARGPVKEKSSSIAWGNHYSAIPGLEKRSIKCCVPRICMREWHGPEHRIVFLLSCVGIFHLCVFGSAMCTTFFVFVSCIYSQIHVYIYTVIKESKVDAFYTHTHMHTCTDGLCTSILVHTHIDTHTHTSTNTRNTHTQHTYIHTHARMFCVLLYT